MYDEQYCKKHNQHYGEFLRGCPICYGEELGKDETMWNIRIEIKEKD